MPRKPRFFLPGVAVHIVQRGHSRNPVFFEDSDYQIYLGLLYDASKRYSCAIHAYVLMTNHIHLLVTPCEKEGVSRLMQAVNRQYVPYINYTYGTSGSIWEGRFKASLIDDEEYLLACMRYIELNPIRANMVCLPEDYSWSSYAGNTTKCMNEILTPHSIYLGLGLNREARFAAYIALFRHYLDTEVLSEIRRSYQTGIPLGNEYFREKIEQKLKYEAGQARQGRPSKGI